MLVKFTKSLDFFKYLSQQQRLDFCRKAQMKTFDSNSIGL